MGYVAKSLVQFLSFIVLSAGVFSLISCGPEKTARQKEIDQLDRTIAQTKAENEKVAGWYLGKIKYFSGVVVPGGGIAEGDICVHYYATSVFQDIAARGESIEVPTLGAYVFLKRINSLNQTTYAFSRSDYKESINAIRSYGNLDGVRTLLLDVNTNGNKLVGKLYAPNIFSEIDVTRVTDKVCVGAVF